MVQSYSTCLERAENCKKTKKSKKAYKEIGKYGIIKGKKNSPRESQENRPTLDKELFFCSTGAKTQGLMHARQNALPLSYTSNPTKTLK